MDRHRKILRSYNRNHRGTSGVETEEAKIAKERTETVRLNKKAERVLSRAVSEGIKELGDALDRLCEEHEAITHAARKTARNAKTHKKRLAELKKNRDFQ